MQLSMKPVLGTITENKGGIFREELISRELVVGFCGKALVMSCLPPAQGTHVPAPLQLYAGVSCSGNAHIPSPWRQGSPALSLRMTEWERISAGSLSSSFYFSSCLWGSWKTEREREVCLRGGDWGGSPLAAMWLV